MKKFSYAFCCVLFVMVSCFHGQPAVNDNPNLDAIKAMLEKTTYDYAQAWCNKDIEFITGTWAHDDDIVAWGVMEKPRSVGWDTPNGVKRNYENSFGSMKEIDF